MRDYLFTPATLRRLSGLVLVTFTSLTLHPLQAAAQGQFEQSALPTSRAQAAPPSRTETAAKLLDTLKETAKRAKDRAAQRQSTREAVRELRRQKTQLAALEQDMLDSFTATEAHLRAKNLPPEILARHQAAVADFKAKQADFKRTFQPLEAADERDDDNARAQSVTQLSTWLDQHQPGKPHARTDPHKLPFRTPDSRVRAPAETARDLRAQLGLNPIRLAGPLPEGTTLHTPVTDPQAPPVAGDLSATEDIQLTPAIQAKAQELGNNPVKIHNWVRNTIEFIPSYGSIQGTEMTLQAKRGNATDIASLEIALLRAANIPARYAYGTIQLPIAQAMNWVGGVTNPEAALNLMGQGGIPSIALTSGGTIGAVKLEHVWVEAYVDYVPSRGAVNKVPDSWVPLDASFKQYTYTQGMDIKSNVPLDANALLAQAQQGATVNAAEGWVQNLNQANIQSALTNYQSQVQNYVNAQNATATVGDVLGTKTIVQSNPALLAGVLPYKTVATGSRFATLPDNLRHNVKLDLYASTRDRGLGSSMLSWSISLPSLNSRRLGVTYEPASAADAQLIQSYKDQGATSLPAYLIQVRPLIQLDGVTVATGSSVGMGQEQLWDATLSDPLNLYTSSESFNAKAGDEMVFGVNGNGLNPTIIQARTNQTQFSNSVAEALHLVSLVFWTEHDLFDYFAAKQHGVHNQRLPSVGLFASPLTVSYFFGIPNAANYRGWVMDVKRNLQVAVANKPEDSLNYLMQSGVQGSYLENSAYEQVLSMKKGKGASATQLLLEASRQGIPIYKITQENIGTALLALQVDDSIKQDIQNAIAAGKTVTISQRAVNFNGVNGATGYIIQDPVTGAGAYLIDGGLNGVIIAKCTPTLAPAAGAVFVGLLLATLVLMSTPETAFAAASTAAVNLGLSAQAASALVPIAALMIGKAFESNIDVFKGSMKEFDECSCREKYVMCLGTPLDDIKDDFNKSRCQSCYERCSDGNWPPSIEIGTCDFQRYL